MGGRDVGGSCRKARNFATFRLFPRAGAVDPNDRVFVRVDNNDYTVPGFADEDSFDPSLSDPSSGDGNFHSASGPLPEHIRREILELGLPDDGYNYLSHLRELHPTAAAASSFVPSSTARPEPLPLDVKAYDASRVRVGPSDGELDEGKTMCKVAAKTAPLRRIQKAVDPDVARLLDESYDMSHVGSEDEGLEEDFVIIANRAEGEELEEEDREVMEEWTGVLSDVEEEEFDFEEDEPKPRLRRLLDEQFDPLALEEYGDSDDDDRVVKSGECELLSEAIDELKLFQRQNVCVNEEYRTPADSVCQKQDSSTADDVDESARVIQKCAEYAERYLNETAEEEVVLLVSESSDESEVWDCETIVSTFSNLENHPGKIETPGKPRKRLPRVFPGETTMPNDIIKLHGKEKLPVEYLPQRRRNGEKEKNVKPVEASVTDKFERGAEKETKEEKKARKAAVKDEKSKARRANKELKDLYKSETLKAQKVAAVTGPSSIRLIWLHLFMWGCHDPVDLGEQTLQVFISFMAWHLGWGVRPCQWVRISIGCFISAILFSALSMYLKF